MHDVYLIRGYLPPLSPRQGLSHRLRLHIRYRKQTWQSHFSILTQSHVFHITSAMASDKVAYFTSKEVNEVSLKLCISNLALPTERLHNMRLWAAYCGRTTYSIEHIIFYAKCLADAWQTYSVRRHNCLMYSFTLAGLIVEVGTTSWRDLWANPEKLGTVQDLRDREVWRDMPSLKRAKMKRLPGLLNTREKALRVKIIAKLCQDVLPRRLDASEMCPVFISKDEGGLDEASCYRYLWTEEKAFVELMWDWLKRYMARKYRK